jgi:uncharacterized Ntn-hydrolase superfamily protein
MVKKQVVYTENIEQFDTETDEPQEPIYTEPVKKKKVLTEKQLQALAAGRAKGLQKLKQSGIITQQKKEADKKVKEIKDELLVENRLKETEDLSKFADISIVRKSVEDLNNKFANIYSKFDNIDSKFNNYLNDREERKKIKQNRVVEETVKKEIPKAVNNLYLQQKLNREFSNNPYLGRV